MKLSATLWCLSTACPTTPAADGTHCSLRLECDGFLGTRSVVATWVSLFLGCYGVVGVDSSSYVSKFYLGQCRCWPRWCLLAIPLALFLFSICRCPDFYWYRCMSCLCGHLERPSGRQGGWRSCFLSDDAMVLVRPLRGASVDLRLKGNGSALCFYSCWRCTVRLSGLVCPSLIHFALSFIR